MLLGRSAAYADLLAAGLLVCLFSGWQTMAQIDIDF